ncbi:hypothetical protein E0485_15070 [Paenibacillus albiflavus]|uniref:Uncharacterized protein n=1 Tax=Paenibacillus albiflavus TaxID=2545760 RepID=A0A4R4EA88_9BACL|nr:hypothetical protein [Paenibacillus albiflavus]TCZ76157.1 hypothetical protein E0485_15070 [Paenibacillus albiflavus]
MTQEKLIVLNDDEKAKFLKSTKDLFFAVKQIHEWVESDSLTEEMAGILPSLIEGHFCDISKQLNYESALTKEKEERHLQIRNANQRIRELEKQLGEAKPLDGLPEQLKHLASTVSNWWNKHGFHHVSDEEFTEYGHYKARFCFMLDHISMFSETPVTDKISKKDRLKQLAAEGYEIVYNKYGRSPELLDNDNNRSRVIKLIQSRFPSAVVFKTRNHFDRSEGYFTIRDMEVYIYDLKDIVREA